MRTRFHRSYDLTWVREIIIRQMDEMTLARDKILIVILEGRHENFGFDEAYERGEMDSNFFFSYNTKICTDTSTE